MKITEILEIADKPIEPDQLPLIASLMGIKLRAMSELVPEIIANINVSLVHGNSENIKKKRDLIAKLGVWENE